MAFIEKVAAHHNASREGHIWSISIEQMARINDNMANDYANRFNRSSVVLIKEKDINTKIKEHALFLENHQ